MSRARESKYRPEIYWNPMIISHFHGFLLQIYLQVGISCNTFAHLPCSFYIWQHTGSVKCEMIMEMHTCWWSILTASSYCQGLEGFHHIATGIFWLNPRFCAMLDVWSRWLTWEIPLPAHTQFRLSGQPAYQTSALWGMPTSRCHTPRQKSEINYAGYYSSQMRDPCSSIIIMLRQL